MATKTRATTVILALSLLAGAIPPAVSGQAPEFYLEGEVVSRYVWRGLPLSSSLNVQPMASMIIDAVDLGVWSSWGVEGYQEIQMAVGYSRDLAVGSLYVSLADYFVTGDGTAFGDFFDYGGVEDGEPTGTHTLELMVEYSGPEEFPIRALVGNNFHGDPDGSWYGELGAELSAGEFGISPVLGMTLNASPYYYGPTEATLNQVGLTISRDLFALGERIAYASGGVIHNPDLDKTFWVLSLGL